MPLDIFTVPAGLEVTRLGAVAAAARIPPTSTSMRQGRIWVTEGVNYRRHKRRAMPKGDRVVVLEDTDRDGRADKSTTFVQEPTLVAPLGIAVHRQQDHRLERAGSHRLHRRGSAICVSIPPSTSAKCCCTGFDGRNHDHALHSVTFGPDGRWYFSQGNAGAHFTDRGGKTFRVGSAYNPVPDGGAQPVFGNPPPSYAGAKSDDGHVYVGGFSARMQPDGTGVEILGFNFRNSYEQTVTSFGDIFHNDNDDPPACRTTYLMEYGNLGFFSRDGKRYWQADRRPGQSIPDRRMAPGRSGRDSRRATCMAAARRPASSSTKATGSARNGAGCCCRAEAARNTIFGYFPKPQGAGYQLDRFDFLTSNAAQAVRGHGLQGRQGQQRRSRPSSGLRMSRWAPDGAIYVADWFDPRVGGHDDKDDTTSGAIYRIAPKGFVPRVPKFDAATIEGADHRAAQPGGQCARAGIHGAASARRGRACPRSRNCSKTRTPTFARAPCGCWRDSAPAGIERVETLTRRATTRCCAIVAYRALRQVDQARAASPRGWRAILRPPCGAKSRCRCVMCRSTQSRDRPARARQRLRRQGPQLSRSLGHRRDRQGRGALRSARPRRSRAAIAAKWPRDVCGSRVAPDAARGRAGVRGAREVAARCRPANAPRRRRRSASSRRAAAANALLDIAQHGGTDIKQNPALWWLINYKDSRWAGARHRRRAQAPRSVRSGRSDDQRSHRAARRRRSPRCPPSPTSSSCAATPSAARPPRAPASCAIASAGRASTTRRRSMASRAGRRRTS